MSPKKLRLATVVATLERHSQRATYGAVGGFVGLPAQSVMNKEVKSHRNAWVVAVKTGEPTGYDRTQIPPSLNKNARVLDSPAALDTWLKDVMS